MQSRVRCIRIETASRRNIYRGTARAFASDDKALRWASELQQSGAARAMTVPARAFSIMPYMHSEKERDQQVPHSCLRLLYSSVIVLAPGGMRCRVLQACHGTKSQVSVPSVSRAAGVRQPL